MDWLRSRADKQHELMDSILPKPLDPLVDFSRGFIDGGLGFGDSFITVVANPIDSAKAVQAMAGNPFLNPGALLTDWIFKGQNPVDNVREGWQQNQQIVKGLSEGYRDQYKENGVAGVVGLATFDIVSTLATTPAGQGASLTSRAATVALNTAKPSVTDVVASAQPNDD